MDFDSASHPSAAATAGRLTPSACADVLEAIGAASFVWEPETDRLVWSAQAEAVLDIASQRLPATGRALQRLLTEETAALRSASIPAFEDGERLPPPYAIEWALRAKEPDGAPDWIVETGAWMPGVDGAAPRVKGILRRLGPRPMARPSPATGSRTGLPDREALFNDLRSLLARLGRERIGSAAFLVISIDGLGDINASFGYEVGDRIIETVAQRIARRMRGGDKLGHLSGHKFGAILCDCSETMLPFAVSRFRAAVMDEPIVSSEAQIQVRILVGGVIVPRHAGDPETAALRAEEAVEAARQENADGFALYQPSPERDQQRRRNLQFAEDIARGIEGNRFVLAYQPVVDARTRELLYYESLSRFVRSDGTIVSAGPIIATAERLGQVREVDRRSLALALADLTRNPELRLSVNAAVVTVLDSHWIGRLVEAVAQDRTIAGRLTIEITETLAMSSISQMRRASETLRDIGCLVAIDDFGSGHTSFKALRDLEVDVVKIDGSYVQDVVTNPDNAVFVRALVTLAEHFGIKTVAEWVQDEKAAQLLADLGVCGLQGRHTGLPLLRVSPETEAVIDATRMPRAAVERDGYPAFSDLLVGPIGGAARVTSPVRAGPAAAAWPRAAS